jgi:hypothetical protein
MGSFGLQKRMRDMSLLPDDVLHIIFHKLEFQEKINCGLVCKQWGTLLKSGTAAARHWVVDYNVNTILAKTAYVTRSNRQSAEKGNSFISRCVTVLYRCQRSECKAYFAQVAQKPKMAHGMRDVDSTLVY